MSQHFQGSFVPKVLTFCGPSQGPALFQPLEMSNVAITQQKTESLSLVLLTYLSILVTPAPPSLGHLHTSKSIVPFPNNFAPHQAEDPGTS